MIDPPTLAAYPRAQQVFELLGKRYPLFHKTAQHIFANLDAHYLGIAEEVLSALDQEPVAVAARVKAFIAYSQEFLVLQARLARDGHYVHRSYDDVSAHLYQNPRMDAYYLDGLLLSQFLWPNHYRMAQYLVEQKTRTTDGSSILDVPCGTGLHSYLLARHFRFAELRGVDISPYSVAYARRLLSMVPDRRAAVAIDRADVFHLPERRQFDFIVCGELLEHLEDPGALLAKLRRLLRSNGTLFLTTAIYAAAIDHIFLFTRVDEVRELLGRAFVLDSEMILPVSLGPYREPSGPDSPPVPINYACVLRPNGRG